MRSPRRSVTLVTAPAVEPVSLSDAKLWAKVDDTADDDLITALIVAARESAEQFLRRSLITQTWKLAIDLSPSDCYDDLGDGVYDLPVSVLYGGLPSVIQLPKGPIQSISSVKTYDLDNTESTYSSSNYTVDTDGDRFTLNFGSIWPANLRSAAAAIITYVAGYGDAATDVPQAIRTAILMHVQKMYDGRIVCDMPDGCQQLLRQYRIMDGLRG